jgi:hypothetical protein
MNTCLGLIQKTRGNKKREKRKEKEGKKGKEKNDFSLESAAGPMLSSGRLRNGLKARDGSFFGGRETDRNVWGS